MKIRIIVVALVALFVPIHAIPTQCAGTGPDNRLESSGFLTADWTQKACSASGGSIDPNKKGNQKCCNVSRAQQDDFNNSCNRQKAGNNYPEFIPTVQLC
ncbi:hypothetical protein PHMEG_0005862 [Phytophthora megakarya]|uniref:Secreted protein n=1 Tax=Phytophthora megakarya TaxID=4795 RepID=A0A225WS01_9STRA|nr:hypothetical protein PHMEG_0005862 [Phytophthora megakarya]